MEEKENAPNEMFAAFIKEIRDQALRYAERADWFRSYGESRMAEIERCWHRYFLDLVSTCEYIGNFKGCCAFLREQEHDLFEKIKYFEECHVACSVVDYLERMWRLRQVRAVLAFTSGCVVSKHGCDKCFEDHPLGKHLLW